MLSQTDSQIMTKSEIKAVTTIVLQTLTGGIMYISTTLRVILITLLRTPLLFWINVINSSSSNGIMPTVGRLLI